jgi:hypothetical protein
MAQAVEHLLRKHKGRSSNPNSSKKKKKKKGTGKKMTPLERFCISTSSQGEAAPPQAQVLKAGAR